MDNWGNLSVHPLLGRYGFIDGQFYNEYVAVPDLVRGHRLKHPETLTKKFASIIISVSRKNKTLEISIPGEDLIKVDIPEKYMSKETANNWEFRVENKQSPVKLIHYLK